MVADNERVVCLTGEHIYFIQVRSGPIKIGYTTDTRRRFKVLQLNNYEIATPLLFHPGTRGDERLLHKRFAAHNIRSEWFRPADDILTYIQEYHGRKTYWKLGELIEGDPVLHHMWGYEVYPEL